VCCDWLALLGETPVSARGLTTGTPDADRPGRRAPGSRPPWRTFGTG
jgi:hypothetical protein